MKPRVRVAIAAIGVSGLLSIGMSVYAAEHGGQEHAGSSTAPSTPVKERSGTTTTPTTGMRTIAPRKPLPPSAEQLRQSIRDYISGIEQTHKVFTMQDDATGTTRTLQLVRVHERVGKTGSLYYSCTDMQDKQTGQLLDLDFDVKATGNTLEVVDVRIHKVNGKARYTYDEHDRRIPVSQ